MIVKAYVALANVTLFGLQCAMLYHVFTDEHAAPNYAVHAIAVVASAVPVVIGLRGLARGCFGNACAAVVCGLFVLRAAEDHVDHFP
eukprot:CAMPEP_0205932146 /NCGR_PEP_ID=MMETSP1325-20131115/28998_1 /ASSEMBLY_ACC=CAM_ASM_000708 /TAXON_ID=236786 /ORGANISM="Florenciella sp., Strain RCC1007" /LENGTH=86 /DNA_ID=CAMNT_0053301821 /DNA_START=34 /DNA_END=291 /DNA_ORIENTATION=+